MSQLRSFLYYLVYAIFISDPYLSAKLPENQELQPTPLMQQETKWLVQALQQAHFNKVSIKDLTPEEFKTNKNAIGTANKFIKIDIGTTKLK